MCVIFLLSHTFLMTFPKIRSDSFFFSFILEGVQEKVSIGEEYCVTVNTTEAGNGAITCHISSNQTAGDVDIHVEDNADGTVSIFYSVKEVGDYSINIKFGGNPVPGGNFSCQVSACCNVYSGEFGILCIFLSQIFKCVCHTMLILEIIEFGYAAVGIHL